MAYYEDEIAKKQANETKNRVLRPQTVQPEQLQGQAQVKPPEPEYLTIQTENGEERRPKPPKELPDGRRLKDTMPDGIGIYESIDEMNNRKMMEAQKATVDKFRADLPGYESQMFGQLSKQGRQGLDTATRGIREAAASRGMLYSGGRQGQEQAARSKVGGLLASGRQEIRSGLNSTLQEMENQMIKHGLQVQQDQQAIQDQIYARALQKMQSENAMFGDLMSGVGMAAGFALSGGNPYGAMLGGAAGRSISGI